jgi:hypothetical protein
MSQWWPVSIGELVDELHAHARSFRNWIYDIENAILEFEYAVKRIGEELPEVSGSDQQRFAAAWKTYQDVPDDHFADARRAIEAWTRMLKQRS